MKRALSAQETARRLRVEKICRDWVDAGVVVRRPNPSAEWEGGFAVQNDHRYVAANACEAALARMYADFEALPAYIGRKVLRDFLRRVYGGNEYQETWFFREARTGEEPCQDPERQAVARLRELVIADDAKDFEPLCIEEYERRIEDIPSACRIA